MDLFRLQQLPESNNQLAGITGKSLDIFACHDGRGAVHQAGRADQEFFNWQRIDPFKDPFGGGRDVRDIADGAWNDRIGFGVPIKDRIFHIRNLHHFDLQPTGQQAGTCEAGSKPLPDPEVQEIQTCTPVEPLQT